MLPSFDASPRVIKQGVLDETALYLWIALGLTCFFVVLEVVEISGLSDGVLELSDIINYCSSLWNLMDWVNYSIFFMAFSTFRTLFALDAAGAPCAAMCATVGYVDEWEIFETTRAGKQYLSLCVCIQVRLPMPPRWPSRLPSRLTT